MDRALLDVVALGPGDEPELERFLARSLLDARAAGATRSILFTGADNAAARSAYLALGYRIVGDYGLVLFNV